MAESGMSRILLVDDDPDVARLVQHVLAANGLGPATQVTTGGDALRSLAGIDIVLLDHQLPTRAASMFWRQSGAVQDLPRSS